MTIIMVFTMIIVKVIVMTINMAIVMAMIMLNNVKKRFCPRYPKKKEKTNPLLYYKKV